MLYGPINLPIETMPSMDGTRFCSAHTCSCHSTLTALLHGSMADDTAEEREGERERDGEREEGKEESKKGLWKHTHKETDRNASARARTQCTDPPACGAQAVRPTACRSCCRGSNQTTFRL